jgi:hypothetical protein
MNKFGGWLAGVVAAIIAAIIGGYAVWYFTRPPSTTILEGMVYAASSAVPKAMVSLELTGSGVNGGSFHNVTDENGSYRFDFTGLPETASATLRVVAAGFRASEPKLLSNPLGPDTHLDFPLTPVIVTQSPGVGQAPHPPAVEHKPQYVRKTLQEATQVRLKP